MSPPRPGPEGPRKSPKQARSRRTRADLLEGATRVLQQHGAAEFTTNRVADTTGVSVGSLYQYYPNKTALLLDLHDQAAVQLWQRLETRFADPALPAGERLRWVIEEFFQVQALELEHHQALGAAAPQNTPVFEQLQTQVVASFAQFISMHFPARAQEAEFLAGFAVGLVMDTGKRIGTGDIEGRHVPRLASSLATMLSADWASAATHSSLPRDAG